MKLSFTLLSVFSIVLATLSTSCQTPSSTQQKPGQTTLRVNKTTPTALIIDAQYGKEYNMDGDIVALYPDFKLRLVSKPTTTTKNPKQPRHIYLYEITTKDDFGNKLITVSSHAVDKKHFYYSGIHFYYHSNELGKINIYVAPQLLATNTP